MITQRESGFVGTDSAAKTLVAFMEAQHVHTNDPTQF